MNIHMANMGFRVRLGSSSRPTHLVALQLWGNYLAPESLHFLIVKVGIVHKAVGTYLPLNNGS